MRKQLWLVPAFGAVAPQMVRSPGGLELSALYQEPAYQPEVQKGYIGIAKSLEEAISCGCRDSQFYGLRSSVSRSLQISRWSIWKI